MYACPGGSDFAAAFSKEGDLATISVPGQPEVELPRQPSGSGFAFGDSYYELRGRGREATLTAGGRSMRCHAIGRPGEPPRTYQGGGLTITLFPDGIFRLRDRSGATETVDVGQWGQEVDGGVRMVLRGGTVARRVFREDDGDKLVAENGSAARARRHRRSDRRSLPAHRPLPRHPDRRPVHRVPDGSHLRGGAGRRGARSRARLDRSHSVQGSAALCRDRRPLRLRRGPCRAVPQPQARRRVPASGAAQLGVARNRMAGHRDRRRAAGLRRLATAAAAAARRQRQVQRLDWLQFDGRQLPARPRWAALRAGGRRP